MKGQSTASDLSQLFHLADFVLTVTLFFQFLHLLLLFESILPFPSQTPVIAYLTTAILSFLNLANTFFTLIKSRMLLAKICSETV